MTGSTCGDERAASHARPAVWGGIECTVARVGDVFRDQVRETGHHGRIDDLDAIGGLGIEALRYPVLWEQVSPRMPDQAEWGWHDERLEQIRTLGIDPILGLVHHGSGPCYTSLTDPHFPMLLAGHARRVAERYPWARMFTPVNEPLTTARFSGLYGHWYPHGRDYRTFLRCLVHECRGVALSMQAIRTVTPDAQLIQTEDMGRTFSTPMLTYQADHENERRWLSFDLLCGRVDRHHPWHAIMVQNGIGADELAAFVDEPCIPDVIGINHYLTSDRYLDQRIGMYPPGLTGGNAHHDYVDTEAVRVEMSSPLTGPEARLREVWERYKLPIAITEVHNGCTREEQLRWLNDIWTAACNLGEDGVDMRAVTVWAMFGAVDWDSLLTRQSGHYETGIFDARPTPIRPTALAKATQSLAQTGSFDHPVLDGIGWWHRHDRYHRPARMPKVTRMVKRPRRLVVTGRSGTLGQAFGRICAMRGLEHDLVGRQDMDIADAGAVEAVLARSNPWAVVNTAGYVRVGDAEHEPERCRRDNAHGAAVLAKACARLGIPLVTFSSDLVFDGTAGRAYTEDDPVSPQGVYGLTKAEAERVVADAHPGALIVRTSAFFGPWDAHNILYHAFREIDAGRTFTVSDEVEVSPTYVPDLVQATLDLLIDGESGIRHLSNATAMTWHAFVRRATALAGLDETLVIAAPAEGARRSTALATSRGTVMPTLEDSLVRFLRDGDSGWRCAMPTSMSLAAAE